MGGFPEGVTGREARGYVDAVAIDAVVHNLVRLVDARMGDLPSERHGVSFELQIRDSALGMNIGFGRYSSSPDYLESIGGTADWQFPITVFYAIGSGVHFGYAGDARGARIEGSLQQSQLEAVANVVQTALSGPICAARSIPQERTREGTLAQLTSTEIAFGLRT